MNRRHPTKPIAHPVSPVLAIDATARPLHREAVPPWASCLGAIPGWSGTQRALARLRDACLRDNGAQTLVNTNTTVLSLSAWEPPWKGVLRIRRENPIRRETEAGRAPMSPPAKPAGHLRPRVGHPRVGHPRVGRPIVGRPRNRATRHVLGDQPGIKPWVRGLRRKCHGRRNRVRPGTRRRRTKTRRNTPYTVRQPPAPCATATPEATQTSPPAVAPEPAAAAPAVVRR